jgi:heme/copper-type cytochrome/quinol oxidase subunit 2
MTRWLIAVGTVVVAVALFLVLRPGDQEPATTRSPTPTATQTGETPETPEPTATDEAQGAIEIEIEAGRVQGPGRIEVSQGDQVRLVVRADVSDEVHVHGYDIFEDVAPGMEAVVSFRADIPGIFEVELESAGLLLTRLEVTP